MKKKSELKVWHDVAKQFLATQQVFNEKNHQQQILKH